MHICKGIRITFRLTGGAQCSDSHNHLPVESVLLLDKEDFDDSNTQ